ncbi:hypothetical protein [Mucilaginibacter pocheonensis]|uniref:Fimbrillin-A associated anchor protein Mfa1 and Mfa2 n=1 Tax=Mucilaginibacter pocheonensis TaxID=398050 RepID=A0ABU1T5X6_9SPHI|nr:hypothetical protein [Mucilaginibacter pocheonensis]MDR6940787.1 hypothetical protein [Mucilaginibacter pocheonensis]
MKNIYLSCIAVCIVALSCKKDSTQKPISTEVNTGLHAVSFTVPGFESTTEGLNTNSAGGSALLKNQIKYLHLVIYKDSGIVTDPQFEQYPQFAAGPVKEVIQKSTDANFGTFKESLSDGQYWFFIVGDQLAGKINEERTNGHGGYWTLPFYHLDNALLTSGIYFGGFDTLIKAPINKVIKLKRMVSKLTIRITDAIPANASKFILTLTDYPPAFDLLNGNGRFHGTEDLFDSALFSYNISTSQIGKSNFEFSTIVLPYRSFYESEIRLDCVDKIGNVINHKVLPSKGGDEVWIERNTNYIYTGAFFTKAAQFTITLDTKWNAPVNIPFSVSYSKPSKTSK